MPKGKGTYGKKVGRPRKKKAEGGGAAVQESGALLTQVKRKTDTQMPDRAAIARSTLLGNTPYIPNPLDFTPEQRKRLVNAGYKLVTTGRSAGTYSSDGVDYTPPLDDTWEGLSERETAKRHELDYKLIINDLNPTDGTPKDLRDKGISNRGDKLKIEILNSILQKRMRKQEGGDIKEQMDGLAISVAPIAVEETNTMLPDETMENNYIDFVVDEALDEQEKELLNTELESNPELSIIFDKVLEVASEFSGAGPIDGPGSGISDSIPARLSDGEFVFTAKAADEIGEDNLMSMMKEAEANADKRQPVANGGYINVDRDDDTQIPIQTTESAKAQSKVQPVYRRKTVEQLEEEMLKANPRRRYAVISG